MIRLKVVLIICLLSVEDYFHHFSSEKAV